MYQITKLVALVCIVSSSLGAQAFSQEQDLENLLEMSFEELIDLKIVTASKKPESRDDAPNVTYVVTDRQIKRRGWKTLEDVLTTIPGIGVYHRDIQKVAQVRGIAPNDNEKITLMINGRSINQVFEPEFFNGTIRLETLARIEIIVGPGSVLYGAETLCAIVNLITKKPDYNEVYVSAGNHDNQSVSFVLGDQNENNHLYLAGTYAEKDGWDAWPSDANDSGNRNLSGTTVTGKLYPSFCFVGNAKHDDWFIQFFAQNSQMPELHLHAYDVADDGRRFDYIYSMMGRNHKQWTDQLSTSFEVFGDLKRILRSVVRVGSGDGVFPNWDISQTSFGGQSHF